MTKCKKRKQIKRDPSRKNQSLIDFTNKNLMPPMIKIKKYLKNEGFEILDFNKNNFNIFAATFIEIYDDCFFPVPIVVDLDRDWITLEALVLPRDTILNEDNEKFQDLKLEMLKSNSRYRRITFILDEQENICVRLEIISRSMNKETFLQYLALLIIGACDFCTEIFPLTFSCNIVEYHERKNVDYVNTRKNLVKHDGRSFYS